MLVLQPSNRVILDRVILGSRFVNKCANVSQNFACIIWLADLDFVQYFCDIMWWLIFLHLAVLRLLQPGERGLHAIFYGQLARLNDSVGTLLDFGL